MLRITRQATRYLRRAREEAGLDSNAGARFVRTPSGVGLTSRQRRSRPIGSWQGTMSPSMSTSTSLLRWTARSSM
jgi:hypothetical protein